MLVMALQGQSEILCSRGFAPTRVYVDLQSSFLSLTTQFGSVMIDVGDATDHVPKADAKIRQIKEIYQGVKSELPWNLPSMMVKDLVAYCILHLNILHMTAINQIMVPKVLFTGVRWITARNWA